MEGVLSEGVLSGGGFVRAPGVARHLSGQTLNAGLRLSHADGQWMWTITGQLCRRCHEGELVGENH